MRDGSSQAILAIPATGEKFMPLAAFSSWIPAGAAGDSVGRASGPRAMCYERDRLRHRDLARVIRLLRQRRLRLVRHRGLGLIGPPADRTRDGPSRNLVGVS